MPKSKEQFYSCVGEAFQAGKKDPYAGLRARISYDMALLWLESLRRQKKDGIPNRYATPCRSSQP